MSKKRMFGLGDLQNEIQTWTKEEMNLFERLPPELSDFILSEHLVKVEDIENACRAFGRELCQKYRI